MGVVIVDACPSHVADQEENMIYDFTQSATSTHPVSS